MKSAQTKASLVVALTLASPTSAQTLIRCPDWQSFAKQSAPVVLAKASPKTTFEQAVKRGGASEARLAIISDSKRVKSSTVTKTTLPAISTPTCPTYKVKRGDTLGSIAQSKMGSAKKHAQLLAANKSVISSAKALKIGTVLTIPCTLAPVVAAKANPKSNGLFSKRKQKPVVQPIPKTVVAVAPAPAAKPLPVWRAKSGEHLSDVIKRRGKTAGYKVIVAGPSAWRLNVPVKEVGTFEETLSRLVKGFSADGQPPSVRVFSNKVIKIGSVL